MARTTEEYNILSAPWINSVMMEIYTFCVDMITWMLDEGWLSEDYLPLETPATSSLMRRMTPEQTGEVVANASLTGTELANATPMPEQVSNTPNLAAAGY